LKILITGSNGMLGRDLLPVVGERHEAVSLTHSQADITQELEVRRAFHGVCPDVVLHTAAMTAVDDCELQPERAFKTNSEGTRNVASACAELGASMLYISTDYVFDGEKLEPYTETDPTHPVSIYGQSKLEGEAHLQRLLTSYWIVRTSWVFGPFGKNFVDAIVGKACQGAKLQVVDDQVGCPTYTEDLARKILEIVEHGGPGLYHVSNQGACSRFEFAQEILKQAGMDPALVVPIPTSSSDRPARRPKNSRLANNRLIEEDLALLPDWKDALRRYFERKPPALA
jgi:dTDP-4-dehydrorhamnose reductase